MKEQHGVSKWFIGQAVLLVVIGIVMLVWPNLTMELLGIMMGICLLVVGLVYIILYFTKDHMGEIMRMDLTMGVVLAALGAFMLMHNDFVSLALPFAAGIMLLIGGISKIQFSVDMRRLAFRHWHLLLIAAIVLIVFALVLLYNPFADKILIYAMGASLIVDGLLSVAAVLTISHRLKKMARGTVYTGYDRQIEEKGRQDAGVNAAYGQEGPGAAAQMNAGMYAEPPMDTVEEPREAETADSAE